MEFNRNHFFALGLVLLLLGVQLRNFESFTLNERTSKFTEELRLAMPLTSRADWLLGFFYTHERGPYNQSILAEDENIDSQLTRLMYLLCSATPTCSAVSFITS